MVWFGFGLIGVLLVLGKYYGGLNPQLLFPLLLTATVTSLGWYVTDDYSKERDRANKQRDLSIQYLLEAYRRIEVFCARDKPDDVSPEMTRGLESAIADIQLFGSARQIELARKLVTEVETSSYTDPRPLLAELRSDLRRVLQLEARPVEPSDIMHFRIKQVLPRPDPKPSPK